MLEFLKDPIWQFIGVVVTVITILVTLGLYIKQRRIKNLSYQIRSITPLLSLSEEVKGILQILYKGKLVDQVHLIRLRLLNSGNTPIQSSDFEKPVSIDFGNKAKILSASILKTDPENLTPSLKIKKNSVVLSPLLMNKGDTINIKILVSRFEEVIQLDGRIVGVKNIKEVEEEKTYHTLLLLLSLIVITYGFFQFFLIFLSGVYSDQFLFGTIFIVVGYLMAFGITYTIPRYKRRFRWFLRLLTK